MKTAIRELNSGRRLGREPLVWRGSTAESIIRRVFGKNAFFHQDSGLPIGYGQVFIDNPNTGSGWSARSVTGRVRIDVVA